MRIDRLELVSFRNYTTLAADFDGRCNVIFGENAQGKDESAGGGILPLLRQIPPGPE